MSNAFNPTNSTLVASLQAFPTSSELSISVRQALQQLKTLCTNFNAGGITQTYIEAMCIALGSDSSTLLGSTQQGAYEILQTVQNAAYVLTASDIFLDLKAADLGVTRKPATYASGAVIFTSATVAPAGGILISAGRVVSANSADPTQFPTLFATVADVTIPAGQTVSPSAAIQAVNAGSAGNVAATVITQVQSGSQSLTVTNPAAIGGGIDAEGDDAPNGGLRFRTLQAIPNASQCTVAALQAAAVSYPGISSATCVDLWDGSAATPGTVLGHAVIYCDDGTGNLSNPADANYASLVNFNADLTKGLWKAAGAYVVAVGAQLLNATVALSIDVAASYLLTGQTSAAVATAVQAAVFGYVQASPLGAPVTLAAVIKTAKEVPGVSNVIVTSVTINGAASDLTAALYQVARCAALSSVTVTVAATTPYA